MIFTTGPLAPRGAYNDSSNRRFACSTVGIPVLRFSTISFVCEGAPTTCILRAAILVWGRGSASSKRPQLLWVHSGETMTGNPANRDRECGPQSLRDLLHCQPDRHREE